MLRWEGYPGLSRVGPMGPYKGKAEDQSEKQEIQLQKQCLEWFSAEEGAMAQGSGLPPETRKGKEMSSLQESPNCQCLDLSLERLILDWLTEL